MIAEYCEEIIVMNEGSIAFSSPTHEVLSNPAIMDAGAMIPQSAIFGHAMAKADKPLARIPITLSEAAELVKERR